MPTRAYDRFFDEQYERDLRYGLEQDPHDELMREFELADRIAEQASLPPVASLRHGGRAPPPRPRSLALRAATLARLRRFAAGERVSHHGPGGDVRPGRVVRALDHDGLVEVDFGRHGTTLVAADELEREAA